MKEGEEAGCYGLVGRLAKNLDTNESWQAESAYKSNGSFYCPACYSDLVIRKCAEKEITSRTSRAYSTTYMTIKTPVYGPDLRLDGDFLASNRKTFTPENERKEIPVSGGLKGRKNGG